MADEREYVTEQFNLPADVDTDVLSDVLQQAQKQGRQLLLLQSGAKPSETLSMLAANTSSMSNDQLLELTLHREREAHRAEVRGLAEARDSLQAEGKAAADWSFAARQEERL